METTSLQDLKKELQELPPKELIELCIALAKYKKDNKEYLGYLLFEAHNKTQFIAEVKKAMDEHFYELQQQPNLYYVKKGLRKQLRLLTKYSKYVNDKTLTAELLIYFCSKIKTSGIRINKSTALTNLYNNQIKKIRGVVETLHEDLQHDYNKEIEQLL